MKSLTKAIAVASLATVATTAQAVEGLSTTVGAVSDYVYRGVELGAAGAYFSVDYEAGGFYVGAWTIDDGAATDGLETDYYLGYGFEQDDLSLGLGYTRYEYSYTANFEHEINLSAGFAGFGLDVALGTADKNASDTSVDTVTMNAALTQNDEQDYTVIELSYTTDVWGVKVGQYDADESDKAEIGESEYKWAEFSASKEVSGIDVTATLGKVFDAEGSLPMNGATSDMSSYGSEYLVLDVSKSFDL